MVSTVAVAWWLQCPPREREVVGSNLGRDRPKTQKLLEVAFALGDYGNSTTTVQADLDLHSAQDKSIVEKGRIKMNGCDRIIEKKKKATTLFPYPPISSVTSERV